MLILMLSIFSRILLFWDVLQNSTWKLRCAVKILPSRWTYFQSPDVVFNVFWKLIIIHFVRKSRGMLLVQPPPRNKRYHSNDHLFCDQIFPGLRSFRKSLSAQHGGRIRGEKGVCVPKKIRFFRANQQLFFTWLAASRKQKTFEDVTLFPKQCTIIVLIPYVTLTEPGKDFQEPNWIQFVAEPKALRTCSYPARYCDSCHTGPTLRLDKNTQACLAIWFGLCHIVHLIYK